MIMKELSIEEKAKAYDEAIERAKNFIENGDERERTIAESIFAGIMEESEDERIRQFLIHEVTETSDKIMSYRNMSKKDVLAWLEKQKAVEVPNIDEAIENWINSNSYPIGDNVPPTSTIVTLVENTARKFYELGLKAGQKPVVEDYRLRDTWEYLDEFIEKFGRLPKDCDELSACIDYVIKRHPKEKHEWSEEDKKMLESCIGAIGAADYYTFDDKMEMERWLKSLHPKSHFTFSITDEEIHTAKKDAFNEALDKIEYSSGEPTFDDGWSGAMKFIRERQWKPSEEQMLAINTSINVIGKGTLTGKYLTELHEQLKTL